MFRLFISASAVLIALVCSQAPEFTQQYQQRIGGAIGELEPIIADFDADAQRSDLTRDEALAVYGRSHEQFLNDRGKSMVEVFERYESLIRQRARLQEAGALYRPVLALSSADTKLLAETRRDFAPAVPLTFSGLFYAGAGFAVTFLAVWLLSGLRRYMRRMRYASDL